MHIMRVIDLFNKIYKGEIKAGKMFMFEGDLVRYNGVDFHYEDTGTYCCIDAEDLDKEIKEV